MEADETVIVQLNSVTSGDPQVSIDGTAGTATVQILDDDSATVSIANANDAQETGSVSGQFTVTLSTTSSTDTVVSYSVGGQHGRGRRTDYTTLSGTVTIAAGETTAISTWRVIDDRSWKPTRR